MACAGGISSTDFRLAVYRHNIVLRNLLPTWFRYFSPLKKWHDQQNSTTSPLWLWWWRQSEAHRDYRPNFLCIIWNLIACHLPFVAPSTWLVEAQTIIVSVRLEPAEPWAVGEMTCNGLRVSSLRIDTLSRSRPHAQIAFSSQSVWPVTGHVFNVFCSVGMTFCFNLHNNLDRGQDDDPEDIHEFYLSCMQQCCFKCCKHHFCFLKQIKITMQVI